MRTEQRADLVARSGLGRERLLQLERVLKVVLLVVVVAPSALERRAVAAAAAARAAGSAIGGITGVLRA